MTEERIGDEKRLALTGENDGERLPFDRRAWALLTREARDSLLRQYGREARGYGDD